MTGRTFTPHRRGLQGKRQFADLATSLPDSAEDSAFPYGTTRRGRLLYPLMAKRDRLNYESGATTTDSALLAELQVLQRTARP